MYLSIAKAGIRQLLQYRSSLMASLPLHFLRVILSLTILGIYTGGVGTISLGIKNYIWIQAFILPMVSSWVTDGELAGMVRTGNVIYDYLKPLDLYRMWFSRLISQRILLTAVTGIPLLLLSVFLPGNYRPRMAAGPYEILVFTEVLSVALILNTALSMLVYISVFTTQTITGSLLLFGSIIEFCGGTVIPYSLFPGVLREIFDLLPFKYGAAFPISILSRGMDVYSVAGETAVQIFWIVIIISAGRIILGRKLKNIVVNGG